MADFICAGLPLTWRCRLVPGKDKFSTPEGHPCASHGSVFPPGRAQTGSQPSNAVPVLGPRFFAGTTTEVISRTQCAKRVKMAHAVVSIAIGIVVLIAFMALESQSWLARGSGSAHETNPIIEILALVRPALPQLPSTSILRLMASKPWPKIPTATSSMPKSPRQLEPVSARRPQLSPGQQLKLARPDAIGASLRGGQMSADERNLLLTNQ